MLPLRQADMSNHLLRLPQEQGQDKIKPGWFESFQTDQRLVVTYPSGLPGLPLCKY